MADIKFSCPHCQQHIQAEQGYVGTQISCPACNGSMMVPGDATAPSPVPLSAQTHAPPPPPPEPVAAPRAGSSGCPSCGNALPRGAVLCTQCGYNLITKKRIVAGKPAALGKPKTDQWEVPWYKTAYPYIGLVVVILGILYFLGRENPAMKLAFLGVAGLYVLTAHIIVVVAAFKEGVGTGFLTLCIPFFALYFVFKTSESDMLKLLYGFAVLINIALKFINLD